ncbi:MAG: Ig-like domain-containing protein [Candidatus Onthomonas sp.]
MARDTKGGRRLSGGQSAAPNTDFDFSLDDTIHFSGDSHTSQSSIDDAVIDEILRSISDQSDTPVPNTPPRRPQQPSQTAQVSQSTQTARPHPTADNSYAAAARAHQQDTGTRPISPMRGDRPVQRTTGPIPDPSYYAMRDPAQTQSFQPARPTHRDTDRLPTLVEEKPIRRKSVVGKVLTFLVAILVLVAIVLGVKMAYILGPSMGWNLPDLSKLPGISTLTEMLPDEDQGQTVGTDPDQAAEEAPQEAAPIPTSVTLDQTTLNLGQGDIAILTATLDTEWDGTIVWSTSDKNVATVTSIGPNIAQVEYVGEGSCSVVAMAAAGLEENPHASCWVVCEPASETDDGESDIPAEGTGEEDVPDNTGTHVDIQLNREDFTLKVGERHPLMDENADQVTWSSSNESVATVSASGVVTAVAPGTATITATGPDGSTAEAIARVKS